MRITYIATLCIILTIQSSHAITFYCSVSFVNDKDKKYILNVKRFLGESVNKRGEPVYIIEGFVDSKKYQDINFHYSVKASSCSDELKEVVDFNKRTEKRSDQNNSPDSSIVRNSSSSNNVGIETTKPNSDLKTGSQAESKVSDIGNNRDTVKLGISEKDPIQEVPPVMTTAVNTTDINNTNQKESKSLPIQKNPPIVQIDFGKEEPNKVISTIKDFKNSSVDKASESIGKVLETDSIEENDPNFKGLSKATIEQLKKMNIEDIEEKK